MRIGVGSSSPAMSLRELSLELWRKSPPRASKIDKLLIIYFLIVCLRRRHSYIEVYWRYVRRGEVAHLPALQDWESYFTHAQQEAKGKAEWRILR